MFRSDFMKLSGVSKYMIRVIGVTTLIIIAAGAVCYRSAEAVYFAVGALPVGLLNAAKVAMLERMAVKISDMESRQAANFARIQYILRFVLTGAVLVFAATFPFANLWGAVAAIFTLPVSAFFTRFYKDPVDSVEQDTV